MLDWKQTSETCYEATLGTETDGVHFSLDFRKTCYRRGPWCLMITVCGGDNHHRWGCFDDADQPTRYYHDHSCAIKEASLIAEVLWADRQKR